MSACAYHVYRYRRVHGIALLKTYIVYYVFPIFKKVDPPESNNIIRQLKAKLTGPNSSIEYNLAGIYSRYQ